MLPAPLLLNLETRHEIQTTRLAADAVGSSTDLLDPSPFDIELEILRMDCHGLRVEW